MCLYVCERGVVVEMGILRDLRLPLSGFWYPNQKLHKLCLSTLAALAVIPIILHGDLGSLSQQRIQLASVGDRFHLKIPNAIRNGTVDNESCSKYAL